MVLRTGTGTTLSTMTKQTYPRPLYGTHQALEIVSTDQSTQVERLPARVPPSPSRDWTPEPCTRCIVEDVYDVELNGRPEKVPYNSFMILYICSLPQVLTVRFHGTSDARHQAILQGDWIYTDVEIGTLFYS